MTRVLIVEDDDDVRHAIARAVSARGAPILEARTAEAALAAAAETVVDVVVLDLGLPDRDGVATIADLLRLDPACRVVVLTGRDEARTAVDALRAGAAEYLTKPFDRKDLLAALDRAAEGAAFRREVQKAQLSMSDRGVVGSSPAWTRVLEELHAVAERSRASVLLLGESGTGKEVLARLLHTWSPRASGPFVTVNAACLPAQLLESELFGHEAGAFTDARAPRQGLFELAHRGTLFIDEIGEFQLELQPKLLRVLEGHPFRRIGGQREILTDVRVVSATNRDLSAMVAAGTFREDLYFRVGVLQLSLPPLRERAGDVRQLVAHFVGILGAEMGARPASVAPRALAQLEAYSWPGNVRELRNVIERALVLTRGDTLDVQHLPAEIGACAPLSAMRERLPTATHDRVSLEEAVRRHILAVYEEHAGNVTRTASALGITRVSLRRHLRQYLTGQDLTTKRT
jgi:DNA-binding NtrC family response regulator